MSWLTDAFRLLWGLLYWNARKSLYRRAPQHRRCPCQAPSDSGRALETACEASLSLNEPGRFRLVCPALVSHPEGLRCSLDTAAVRPYWGRAALLSALVGLVCWSGTSAGVFAFLRHQGFSVRYADVAWPLHWHRINLARAAYFRQLGFDALQRGRLREASINLHIAWTFEPGHGQTALVLARLAALTNTALSDDVSLHLLDGQAALAEPIAQEWLSLLVARGDFAAVRRLALERVRTGGASTTAWLHALLTATRQLKDTATLEALREDPSFAAWRPVFETELLHRSGRTAEAVARLTSRWTPPQSYYPYHQTHLLLRMGQPAAALDALAIYDQALPERDRIAVWLDAWAGLGRTERRRQAVSELLGPPPTAATLVLLANHLISHPDATLVELIWTRLARAPLADSDASVQAYGAFFCAAGFSANFKVLEGVKAELHRRLGARFLALDHAESYFRKSGKDMYINTFLPLLSLPVTTLYALNEAALR